ncbi:MAG TPA: hypothetical protein VFI78_06315 [Salinimicrobium sp.]|nr:hypothetical protein [Salinimicrobium sp.]
MYNFGLKETTYIVPIDIEKDLRLYDIGRRTKRIENKGKREKREKNDALLQADQPQKRGPQRPRFYSNKLKNENFGNFKNEIISI